MFINRRVRHAVGGPLLIAGAVTVGASALFSAVHPAAAASILSAVTCAVTGTAACVSGTNTSSGVGVYGTSNTGTGVRGLSTTNYGLKATSTSSNGVLGGTSTGKAGVEGTSASSYGVYGHTTGTSGGTGVYGASSSGYGVEGETTTGNGYGVVGYENGSGTGVYGFSLSSSALQGVSSSGYGLYAQAYGTGSAAYLSANSGYGLIAYSAGAATVYARNSSGNAGDFEGTYIGVVGRAPASGGYPLVLTDQNSNNLFYVDGAGNVSYRGGLSSFAQTAGGATIKAFSTKTTSPTVEDTGTAQLVGGVAAVRLDPTFAASIDTHSAYRVFVTPNADSHGLYVATKTPNGFIVHESQNGRSTLTFDYRIVATASGQTGQRMAVTTAALGGAAPRSIAPNVPVVQAARPLPQH